MQPAAAVRAAVQVRVPEGLHLQSNAPRDPSLIPTKLSSPTPAGVPRSEVVFPGCHATSGSPGIAEPLAVFEHEFPIGVGVRGGCDRSRPERSTSRPAALSGVRRQAVLLAAERRHRAGRCASLPPDGATGALPRTTRPDRVRYRRAPAAAQAGDSAGAARRRDRHRARQQRRARELDRFTVRGDDRRLPRAERLPARSSATRRTAIAERGTVRRPRPARDSAARAARRPGAQPDAVRAADDPDQPRDHRRRRAGRVARARLPARLASTARPWRWSTACSA